jgi:hypothetical protein
MQQAYKVSKRVFKCFPQSTNTLETGGTKNVREFEEIEAAAIFLLKNPTWGIRMNPGSAIVYRNIEIVR